MSGEATPSDAALVPVRCHACSAPLQVPANARFVTCHHCGSQLEVKSSGAVTWTETLQGLDERTRRIEAKLDDLASGGRSDVPRFDRPPRPSEARGKSLFVTVLAGVVPIVFGIFWIAMVRDAGAPALFPLFGVLFVVIGLYQLFRGLTRAARRREAS